LEPFYKCYRDWNICTTGCEVVPRILITRRLKKGTHDCQVSTSDWVKYSQSNLVVDFSVEQRAARWRGCLMCRLRRISQKPTLETSPDKHQRNSYV